MHNTVYCTYFDKGFLLKGLALHASLIKNDPSAKLWILALDAYTEKILKKIALKGVTVVSMTEFEDKDLLKIKKTRSLVEYYWTCTPSWPLYIFNNQPKTKYVVYVDADLYFFSSAVQATKEIGEKSLLVVEHRFPKGQEILARRNGRFNLAFNIFKKDKEGISCLKRWRNQCLEWCYAKSENGKMGDQGYLDEWPTIYKGLVISKNLGLDVAPWNVSQYNIIKKGEEIFINGDHLVCYHFHEFQIIGPKNFNRVSGYLLPKKVFEIIYKPYEFEIEKQYRLVLKMDKNFSVEKPKTGNIKKFKQSAVKYLGPIYWRIKTLIYS